MFPHLHVFTVDVSFLNFRRACSTLTRDDCVLGPPYREYPIGYSPPQLLVTAKIYAMICHLPPTFFAGSLPLLIQR